MKRLKKPIDYIDDFTHAKAQLFYLEKEYIGKIKGEVYRKRSMYYNNKILACKKILANYCQPEGTRLRVWKVQVEKEIGNNIYKTQNLSITLDCSIGEVEVAKLIEFNMGCQVTQMRTDNKIIEVGIIKYL